MDDEPGTAKPVSDSIAVALQGYIQNGTAVRVRPAAMMSSQEIIFTSADGLEPGMSAEVALAWPFLLDYRIRLQLVLQVMITAKQDGVAQARILVYDFRSAGPAEAPGC